MRNRSENQVTLVLIRHGATKSNGEHRYLGKTEEGLSPEGKRLLTEYGQQGRYPSCEYLFCSPMGRCRETAEILYPKSEPMIISEWTEMDFGAFEGKNYQELNGDQRYQAWLDSNGTLPFPEGESRESFTDRCDRGFQKMLRELERVTEATVGVIAHGGTIMALLSKYCGGDYFDYQVPNGGGYVCTLGYPAGRLELKVVRSL